MIQIGIWTGQKWGARLGNGPKVLIHAIMFERAEVMFEMLTCAPEHPFDTMDLTSFVQRYELVSNG